MPGLQIYQRFPKASSVLITLSNRPDYEWSHIRRERGHEDPGDSINRLGKICVRGVPDPPRKMCRLFQQYHGPWGPMIQAIESHPTLCQVGKTQHFVEKKMSSGLKIRSLGQLGPTNKILHFWGPKMVRRRLCTLVCMCITNRYLYVSKSQQLWIFIGSRPSQFVQQRLLVL